MRETPAPGVMIDASVAVPWFVDEVTSLQALRLLRGTARLTAPDFMAIELTNALWKKNRRREIGRADVFDALTSLSGVGIQWIPTRDAVTPATRLALEIGHPVYDCLYLVLARAYGVQLATFDERLSRAASLSNVPVFPLKGRA